MTTNKPPSYAELAHVLDNLPLLLRETRRARGLALRPAAEQIGIGHATVSRMEKGDDCALSNVVAVIRWLDQWARNA